MSESTGNNNLGIPVTAKITQCIQPETVVDSHTLFHGQREVWIEHEGERYRLRITRRGKLILQK